MVLLGEGERRVPGRGRLLLHEGSRDAQALATGWVTPFAVAPTRLLLRTASGGRVDGEGGTATVALRSLGRRSSRSSCYIVRPPSA